MSGCEYCTGEPLKDRAALMSNQAGDYFVFINQCNFLEDNVIGGSKPHSLYGVHINFCPRCGRDLGKGTLLQPKKMKSLEERVEHIEKCLEALKNFK